ncbi:MAG: murein biosynthesis integral membrane protein MurJ [Chloroflexi bacterium]|nr:murein biosynthesis integral membrane protein MurJ [Chloroflexota bacterium]MCL5274026.1 murein biosynthesis integral membrane protein MurJ [Chloroflexota bacterium]
MLTSETAPMPAEPEQIPLPAPRDTQNSIAGAATIISLGNLSSRVVGLFREVAKSYFFGNGRIASAFELASNPPSQFYDLLIGGMLSSALVPTFSNVVADEADSARMVEFGKLLGALIGLATVGLTVLVVLLSIFSEGLAMVLAGGPQQDLALVSSLLRITIPTIIFLNLSGILTAALYARRKFIFTAFTATAYNLTMILCVVLFERSLSVTALAIGMLAGSILQVLMQVPGMRGIPIKLSLNWRHPGIRQILRLFLPVAFGLALAQLAALVSFIIAGHIGAEGPATMRYAAQVVQFPLGMIVVAVSAAILPALSMYGQDTTLEAFKGTLAQGMRLVWVLIVPASMGLFVLAQPIVALLFQRGAFTVESTAYTAAALRAAVPGLIFAAIDQPLIYAFYARRDTFTPTLIGLVSTLSYLALLGTLSLMSQYGLRTFTLTDLIMANSLKTGLDAFLMAIFLTRKVGGLRGYEITPVALKVCLAAGLMGLSVWAVMLFIQHAMGSTEFIANALTAVVAAGIGIMVYLLMVRLLRVKEISLLRGMLRRSARVEPLA